MRPRMGHCRENILRAERRLKNGARGKKVYSWSMEREEKWNERMGKKIFVCKKERERDWELKKLKAWKLGKRQWEIIEKFGTLKNMKLEHIRKIESVGNLENIYVHIWEQIRETSIGNMKNVNLKNIRKIESIEIWKIRNGKISKKMEVWKVWKIWNWKYVRY